MDGGVTRVDVLPPAVRPNRRSRRPRPGSPLYRSNLYIVVAGKIYADPDGVRPRTLRIALAALGSLLYATTRGDLASSTATAS